MQSFNINFDDIPTSISEFFTPEQFAEISEYEKKHLSNLRQNFEALRRAGILATPPEFMCNKQTQKKRQKVKTLPVLESSDKSNAEWTPALEKPRTLGVNQSKRLIKSRMKASSKNNTKEKVPGPTKRKKQVYCSDNHAWNLGIHIPRSESRLGRKKNLQNINVDTEGHEVFSCDDCQMSFSQSWYLEKHLKCKHHNKYLELNYKLHSEISGVNLKIHKRKHTGEKPFKCGVCNVGFAYSFNLKRHERIHTREKPYKCGVCNAEFSRCDGLKNHKKIHTGETKCDVCNAEFSWSDGLKTHKKIHTRETKCGVCNAEFSSSNALKRHKRIHTGEKPYKCGICNVGFTRSDSLKRHTKTCAGERDFTSL